ncbi:MAG: protein tyrosine phosphatase [Verrucomicrobia bacterium]|nr:MAG: protein tyrosine phosphatase [Verrucomicrobiota bacterium]
MNFSARQCDRRSLAFGFVFIPAALLAVTLVQKDPPVRPADADSPVAIWDIDLKLANALPRNFRTTDDSFKASKGETPATTGLNDLRASGSGEFTPEGLKLVLARTRGPVMVFDLRQETHIFVNDLLVSWYASRDWANVGRSQSAIEADETSRVESLKPGSEIDIRPGEPVKKGDASSAEPQHVTVASASTERDVVGAVGANYVRITVTDHTRPLDDEVDRFILAVRALPENAWAHFHCEAGRGRTTTFMVLYDMLRNATRVSLEDIVRRQKILGYDYDVLHPSEPGDWRVPYTADRAAFVRAFYDYARANPNGRPQLWTEWLKSGAR